MRLAKSLTNENEKGFVPSPDTVRAYRDALGQFTTGVTIITADTDGGPIGMTVNSFTSVSLTPPLVLWSLSNSAGRFKPFLDAKHYAIHVLAKDQETLALAFAREADVFSQCNWHVGKNNVPLIEGAIARFECSQHALHRAGDHTLILGQVKRVTTGAGQPLAHAQGTFGAFEPNRPV